MLQQPITSDSSSTIHSEQEQSELLQRCAGNNNKRYGDNVIRAKSPEGRRYFKPVNGIQTKGFARSAQRRSSVITLGPIERLQRFYAKRDLKVNKVGILGFHRKRGGMTPVPENDGVQEDDDEEEEDLLPEEPQPPRPTWTELDVETDLDVLVGQCFQEIETTLGAWSMITHNSDSSSKMKVATLVKTVRQMIDSVRTYTMNRQDLSDAALVQLRRASLKLISVMKDLEYRHKDVVQHEDLVLEREAILEYLGAVVEYAFNPPHHIGSPPVALSPEIKSLMTRKAAAPADNNSSSSSATTTQGGPSWLDDTQFASDPMGRCYALLTDNILEEADKFPDPHKDDDEEEFLKYLADGKILCNAYNNIVKRSRRPFGFIQKIHQDTNRTFRAVENLRFFAAACKFRFDLSFDAFDPSEIARKTDRGLSMLRTAIVRFCDSVIAELRENAGKKRALSPDTATESVEKKLFTHSTTTAINSYA